MFAIQLIEKEVLKERKIIIDFSHLLISTYSGGAFIPTYFNTLITISTFKNNHKETFRECLKYQNLFHVTL